MTRAVQGPLESEALFEGFTRQKAELIPLLQKAQNIDGYLSEESMEAISRFLDIPAGHVFGVATFYAQFRFKPKGRKHIMLCRGTACHVKGAPRIMEELEKHLQVTEGETSAQGDYSLESVACIGACGLAPCITVNHEVKGRLTPKMVGELFNKKEGQGTDGK